MSRNHCDPSIPMLEDKVTPVDPHQRESQPSQCRDYSTNLCGPKRHAKLLRGQSELQLLNTSKLGPTIRLRHLQIGLHRLANSTAQMTQGLRLGVTSGSSITEAT